MVRRPAPPATAVPVVRAALLVAALAALAALFALALVAPASPAHAQYTPGVSVVPPNVAPGGSVTVTACCFAPGSTVTFTVGGATLGTALADANGVASGTFTVPANVSGALTVAASDGTTTQSATVTVTGVTATTAGVGGLPVTGSDARPLGLAAAGLVGAGVLVLIGVTRRRAPAAS